MSSSAQLVAVGNTVATERLREEFGEEQPGTRISEMEAALVEAQGYVQLYVSRGGVYASRGSVALLRRIRDLLEKK